MKLVVSAGSAVAGHRQCIVPHVALHQITVVNGRPGCLRRAQHRTRHVARVVQESKSSAEAFIESIEDSLRQQKLEAAEESVVAADIGQLQQQVTDLQQQVRCLCCMGLCLASPQLLTHIYMRSVCCWQQCMACQQRGRTGALCTTRAGHPPTWQWQLMPAAAQVACACVERRVGSTKMSASGRRID